MNYQQIVFGILVLIFFLSYTREGYDYKVYKQASDSAIPKRKYRSWKFPYEWAYRSNEFPLPKERETTEQYNAPMGACLIENALWTCSL